MMKFSTRQLLLAKIRIFVIKLRNPGLTVGRNVYIGRNCAVSAIYKLHIGSNVYIGKNVTIEVEGSIGSGTIIANNVGIIGRKDHDISSLSIPLFDADTVRDNRELSLPIHIGANSWIGFGAIILSGINIGENSIIAAGAVVSKDTPANAISTGNPSKVLRIRDEN